jgi:hypothetical protein
MSIEKSEGKMIDRTEASRALAKAIAYANCGKSLDAKSWTIELVKVLGHQDLLK